MAQLSQLLSRLPETQDMSMSTMGHVLWVCWHGKLAPAVGQTLLNYGGMLVGEEEEQALWFFFTDDVFLALARLMAVSYTHLDVYKRQAVLRRGQYERHHGQDARGRRGF